MADLASGAFVTVLLTHGADEKNEIGRAWGVYDHGERLTIVYGSCLSVWEEQGHSPNIALLGREVDSLVLADNTNTPEKAWVALTIYRLTDVRPGPSDFVKGE